MKYIICAKEVYEGTSTSDVANPTMVTEIATELIITRLYCIDLLKQGKISKHDTIVTGRDRKCLYEGLFDNVISWKEFKGEGEIIDLLEPNLFRRLSGGIVDLRLIPYKPFYQNWERDKNEILNLKRSSLTEYDLTKPFTCLVIRKRSAWSEKNLSDEYWFDLISRLENPLVFGRETEIFCQGKAQYIKSFQDWCSIVGHPNCKEIISTISGGVYPAFIWGNKESTLTIMDTMDLVKVYGYDPSWYNSCINFSGIKTNIITHLK